MRHLIACGGKSGWWAILTSIPSAYATYIASYGPVFGHLATFYALLINVYLLANAFLVGIQLDARVRERA